jgi:hypothetical protein
LLNLCTHFIRTIWTILSVFIRGLVYLILSKRSVSSAIKSIVYFRTVPDIILLLLFGNISVRILNIMQWYSSANSISFLRNGLRKIFIFFKRSFIRPFFVFFFWFLIICKFLAPFWALWISHILHFSITNVIYRSVILAISFLIFLDFYLPHPSILYVKKFRCLSMLFH